jgi:molybdate transport system ATP-binding protein
VIDSARAPNDLNVTIDTSIRAAHADAAFRIDVEFAVPPGVTVLFGPSGSGKTSILHAIAGIRTPEAGRIALGADLWFDGARINVPIHERRVAYVFQSLALFPHLTVAANVA